MKEKVLAGGLQVQGLPGQLSETYLKNKKDWDMLSGRALREYVLTLNTTK